MSPTDHEGKARDARTEIDRRDRHGQTALMRAAHAGDLGEVARLIEAGADLDVTAKYRLSATMLAVIGGHGDVARALAAAGADLGIIGSGAPGFAGKTAAELAENRGDAELASYLRRSRQRQPGRS